MKTCPLVVGASSSPAKGKKAPYPTPAGASLTPGPSIRQRILDALPLAVLLQQIVEGLDRQRVQRPVGFGRQDPQRPPALQVHPDQQPLEGSGIAGLESGRLGWSGHLVALQEGRPDR
jgi:hypothetical protein